LKPSQPPAAMSIAAMTVMEKIRSSRRMAEK
jgi:hypothetical protein